MLQWMRKSLLTYLRDMILHDHSPPLLALSVSRNGRQHSVRSSPTCRGVGSSRFIVQYIAVNTAFSPTIIKVTKCFPPAQRHVSHPINTFTVLRRLMGFIISASRRSDWPQLSHAVVFLCKNTCRLAKGSHVKPRRGQQNTCFTVWHRTAGANFYSTKELLLTKWEHMEALMAVTFYPERAVTWTLPTVLLRCNDMHLTSKCVR